jgi:hypothetical protein
MLVALALTTLSSCSNEKRLAKGKPLKNRSSSAILSRYYPTEFDFEWVGMKLDAELEGPEGSQSFKATVRMRRDSVIWISIAPLMGVEMLRAVITPDSVKYVSKVPKDKHYFIGSIDDLSALTKTDLRFEMIQGLLVGHAIDLDESNDKFISRIDERNYVLFSKYNRKMKKIVGADERELEPDDSLEVETTDKKYRRILKRADEEDLLMKRYWFDGETYRLVQTVFDDLYYQRSLTIEHLSFEDYQEQTYPEESRLTLGTIDGNTTFTFETVRLRTGKEYEFPFSIPEDYERKYAP